MSTRDLFLITGYTLQEESSSEVVGIVGFAEIQWLD